MCTENRCWKRYPWLRRFATIETHMLRNNAVHSIREGAFYRSLITGAWLWRPIDCWKVTGFLWFYFHRIIGFFVKLEIFSLSFDEKNLGFISNPYTESILRNHKKTKKKKLKKQKSNSNFKQAILKAFYGKVFSIVFRKKIYSILEKNHSLTYIFFQE